MLMAEHSMCHPGKPSPHGLGHFMTWVGWLVTHSAKSEGCRRSGSASTRAPACWPSRSRRANRA